MLNYKRLLVNNFINTRQILKSFTLFICKINIYSLIHNTRFSPSARQWYSVFVPTKINMILAQCWYNVHVPTMDELRWSNIGTMSMHQQ